MMTSFISHFDWDALYLMCLGFGLALSVIAFVGGTLHLHIGHLKLHGRLHGKAGVHGGGGAPALNGFTVVAFLAWFGGTGYLLSHGRVFTWALVLVLSVLSGLAGSGLVFWFLTKVMLPREHALEPADTPIVGVLGRVSAAVPATGVGEMLYSQNGARRSMPIAADDGVAIPRGAEVVVLRFQRGVAYVRRWEEMQMSLLGDTSSARSTDLASDEF